MVEVITFTAGGRRIDCATPEDDSDEAVLTTARTLWEDSLAAYTGVRSVGVFDGSKLVRLYDSRP